MKLVLAHCSKLLIAFLHKTAQELAPEIKSPSKVTEGSLWQADHVVPMWRGGGLCGLENLQTLCTACHKNKTKEEAKERKERSERKEDWEQTGTGGSRSDLDWVDKL